MPTHPPTHPPTYPPSRPVHPPNHNVGGMRQHTRQRRASHPGARRRSKVSSRDRKIRRNRRNNDQTFNGVTTTMTNGTISTNSTTTSARLRPSPLTLKVPYNCHQQHHPPQGRHYQHFWIKGHLANHRHTRGQGHSAVYT